MSPLLSHLLAAPATPATTAQADDAGSHAYDRQAGAAEPAPPRDPAARARPRGGLRRAFGQRGQALVEFAIVLPVLMLIILGIVKGGILYNNYLQLTDAVRSGARQLAIERGQTGPCGDAANEVITAASGLSSSNVAITMTENPEATGDPAGASYTTTGAPSGTGSCPFTLVSGSATTLTATYPCDFNILGIQLATCTLSASATERVE
jgi:Flp pilus assembly protein TadG